MHDCPCCGTDVFRPVELSGRVAIVPMCEPCGRSDPGAGVCDCGRTRHDSSFVDRRDRLGDTEYRNGSTCGPDCASHGGR